MRIDFPGRRGPLLRKVFSRYVEELQVLPACPGVVVYFDLDRTLISGYTITSLAWDGVWSGISRLDGLLLMPGYSSAGARDGRRIMICYAPLPVRSPKRR